MKKYVWLIKDEGIQPLPHAWNCRLYLTNRSWKLNEKAYCNEMGFAQKRKTEMYLGRVLYSGKNLSFKRHVINLKKLIELKYYNLT